MVTIQFHIKHQGTRGTWALSRITPIGYYVVLLKGEGTFEESLVSGKTNPTFDFLRC